MDPKDLYLKLMKRCLLNYIYSEAEEGPGTGHGFLQWAADKARLYGARARVNLLRQRDVRLANRLGNFDPAARAIGRDWPRYAHTMVGEARLENIRFCVEDALENAVPGDLIETGVWRGGSAIFMRAILEAHGVTDRSVWVADSFQGLPAPDLVRYPQDKGDIYHVYEDLRVSMEQVQENFRRYGLLDQQVRFLPGWFSDTLPTAPIRELAVLRLDGDMYGSTMDAIRALYPKLSIGGWVIVDDYGAVATCRQAIDDYRAETGIEDPIVPVDWTGVHWQRTE